MGDVRYLRPLARLRDATDRVALLAALSDVDVVEALAALTGPADDDRYLANLLAVEAGNRLRRARTMTQHATDAIVAVDVDGICRDANPAAVALTGRGVHELVGSDVSHSLAFRDPAGLPVASTESPFHSAVHRSIEGEGRIRRPDGTTFAVSYRGGPIADESGSRGAVLVLRDIEAASTQKLQMARAEHRHSSVLDAIQDVGILLLSREGVIETWNEGAHRLFGYESGSIVGRHVGTLYPADDRRRELAEHELALAARDGPHAFEGPRTGRDGRVISTASSLFPIREAGSLRGFALVIALTEERLPWTRILGERHGEEPEPQ